MELKELIGNYKRKHQLTNTEIANRLNVTKATVSRWLSGDVKRVQGETMERLNQLFGYDVDKLLNGQIFEFKKPVLGYVKAGYDMFAEENYLGLESVTESEERQGDFFLRVVGDSMIGDGIIDGSLAYVLRCQDVDSGTISVVLIGDDEVTIKRVIKKSDMIVLESSNPQVPSRYFTANEVNQLPVQIIGKVVYVKTVY